MSYKTQADDTIELQRTGQMVALGTHWENCPAHKDTDHQLFVIGYPDGFIRYRCEKGCSGAQVLKAMEEQEDQ